MDLNFILLCTSLLLVGLNYTLPHLLEHLYKYWILEEYEEILKRAPQSITKEKLERAMLFYDNIRDGFTGRRDVFYKYTYKFNLGIFLPTVIPLLKIFSGKFKKIK